MRAPSRFVVAVCLAACTPATRTEPASGEPPAPAPVDPGRPQLPAEAPDDGSDGRHAVGTPLLLVAQYSAPVSGGGAMLMVYDDGRAFMRGGDGMGEPSRSWVSRVTPGELATLQRALASAAYRKAEPHYHEDGVMDGGSVLLADPISTRKIVVVNDPHLPAELDEVHRFANALHRTLRESGQDPFDPRTPTELRMLAFHRQWWTDDYESFDFVVYADGKLELCKTNGDDRWGPNDESRYPACRVRTVPTERLATLERLVAKEGLARAPTPSLDTEGKTVHILQLRGFSDWLRFDDEASVSADQQAVVDELVALRAELELP